MENGSVGEARTRSFLIDRFWVLKRSVDTDGADFLIQRRTTTQRFTDKVPPRVGVVQAKFFQDRRTSRARLCPRKREPKSQSRGRRLGLDPQAWLADILARLNDHPAKRIDELLPWNWTRAGPQKAAA